MKTKRKVHIDEQEWNWWVSYDRYREPYRVTIGSPDKKFYIYSPDEILGKECFYYREEGYSSPITIISLIGYWSKSYPALTALIAYVIGIAVMKIKHKKDESFKYITNENI